MATTSSTSAFERSALNMAAPKTVTPLQPPGSPNRSRIKALSAKISSIHAGTQSHRETKRTLLLATIRSAEDALARTEISIEGSFKLTQDRIAKLHEAAASERAALEVLDERKAKELQLMESTYELESGAEKQERIESEDKLERIISERLDGLQTELAQECQNRAREGGDAVRHLNAEVHKLREAFEAERAGVEDIGERLLADLTGELRGVEELLAAETKVREETEKTMLKIIEESSSKLTSESQASRRDREESHEGLLRVLEQTCIAVEQSLAN